MDVVIVPLDSAFHAKPSAPDGMIGHHVGWVLHLFDVELDLVRGWKDDSAG